MIVLSIILCAIALPNSHTKQDCGPQGPKTQWQQLQRIDFKGTVAFTLMTLAFLLPTELGGKHFPWTHPLIISLFAASIGLLVLFIWVEKRAAEPIIPLEIFHKKDAVLSYAVTFLQTGAQVGVCIHPRLPHQRIQLAENLTVDDVLRPALLPSNSQHLVRRSRCTSHARCGGKRSGRSIIWSTDQKVGPFPYPVSYLTWLTLAQIRSLQSPRCLRHTFLVRQLPRPYASMAR